MAHYDSECKYCKEEFEKAYEYLKLIKFPVTSYYSEYEKKYAISIAKWAKEFNKKDFI